VQGTSPRRTTLGCWITRRLAPALWWCLRGLHPACLRTWSAVWQYRRRDLVGDWAVPAPPPVPHARRGPPMPSPFVASRRSGLKSKDAGGEAFEDVRRELLIAGLGADSDEGAGDREYGPCRSLTCRWAFATHRTRRVHLESRSVPPASRASVFTALGAWVPPQGDT
jgi:hypothetical protein